MKHLLFVHTAGDARPYVQRLRAAGFRSSLIKKCPSKTDRDCFDHVVDLDYQEDLAMACQRAAEMHARDPFSGVLSFSESGVLGASFIAAHLGLPGNTATAALRARNKYLMRRALREAGLPTPEFYLVNGAEQTCALLQKYARPMVLKPISGSSSYGVVRLSPDEDMETIAAHFDSVRAYIRNYRAENPQYPFEFWLPNAEHGIDVSEVFDPEQDFLLEGFIPGQQVSVDGIVCADQVSCLGVIEIERIKDEDYFLEYEEWMPTRLGATREEAIQDAVADTVAALGLSTSCFHCELKVDGDQVCVLEIAARRGADNIADFLHKMQDVDIYEEGARIACGEKRYYPRRPANGAMKMRYFLPERSGLLQSIEGLEAVQSDGRLSELCLDFAPGERVFTPPDGFEFLGYLSVCAADLCAVDRALEELYSQVRFCIEAEDSDAVRCPS
jgi:biotin carboxylase